MNCTSFKKDFAKKTPRAGECLREYLNPLELPDDIFIKCFQMNKPAFRYLLSETAHSFVVTQQDNVILPINKLSIALRFFVNGCFLRDDIFNLDMPRAALTSILTEVLKTFQEHKIFTKWIVPTMSNEEKQINEHKIFELTGFHNVFGCVKAFYKRIIAPPNDIRHLYYTSFGFYSINVLIICDSQMKIKYVDATQPGSKHKSNIWRNSSYRQSILNNSQENNVIFGDSAFSKEQQLITPYRGAINNTTKANFNAAHAKVLEIGKNTVDALQLRFGCLRTECCLLYEPEIVTEIVNACCALYNIALHFEATNQNKEMV